MSPDRRQHRGAHPADRQLFAAERVESLRAAVAELSWLLTRGYASKSAVKIVGDRHDLTERQRLAVARAACSDQNLAHRAARLLPRDAAQDEQLVVDGFNLIITTEAALGGGVLLLCRDECVRDLSSVHGSYRAVTETERALVLLGEELTSLRPAAVRWLLDKPISNSGRLAQRIRSLAAERGLQWSVELVFNPDREIADSAHVAVTSDSNVLDGAARWVNVGRTLIETRLGAAWVIDLRPDA
ncbi:MAG TPA: DUF434 domain-containing protein [Pyrinomonadaceae bacterium]|nr:DUF434 domain-containing protein [Pyrinomonadaceae bacterium]